MKRKNKNKSKKAIKEELFKPYILTHGEKAVLDTNIDVTPAKLGGINIKAKKEMVVKETDNSYALQIEGMIKNDIRDIIGMNDHPCAETDIDRLDEIERYIDTLKG